jgi:hypothetical protein
MSGWSCKFEVNETCLRLDGAYCRPGMKGCILHGQVTFQDGIVPAPTWPRGHLRNQRTGGSESAVLPEDPDTQRK